MVVVAPSGDLACAVIVGHLYTDALPPPTDAENADLIQFDDGTYFQYDSDAHELQVLSVEKITIASGNGNGFIEMLDTGQTKIMVGSAVGVFKPNGDIELTGNNIKLNGININSSNHVTGVQKLNVAGIDHESHKHTEQGDGAPTSPPQN